MKTEREISLELEKAMGCNCDLDNWQPENSTKHSWVCRIHKEAMIIHKAQPRSPAPTKDDMTTPNQSASKIYEK